MVAGTVTLLCLAACQIPPQGLGLALAACLRFVRRLSLIVRSIDR
jgi:hypothetical protein